MPHTPSLISEWLPTTQRVTHTMSGVVPVDCCFLQVEREATKSKLCSRIKNVDATFMHSLMATLPHKMLKETPCRQLAENGVWVTYYRLFDVKTKHPRPTCNQLTWTQCLANWRKTKKVHLLISSFKSTSAFSSTEEIVHNTLIIS